MPATAEIVDELRAVLGDELVNRAIAAGVKAQKRYGLWLAAHGPEAAAQWLEQQRFEQGSFWAREDEHEVGVRRRA